MTTTRMRFARIAVPAAAVMLALTACSSSGSESSADEMKATASAEAMESKESEAMESKESEAMESHSDDSDAMESEAMESKESGDDSAAMEQAGAFIDYAAYQGSKEMYDAGTVVLFFNASWCPTCQEAVKNLEGDAAAIPSGLTVVSIDYDSSDDLKQQYGVTTQHTFVQVDADGNEIAKWTGSVTADEIAKQTA